MKRRIDRGFAYLVLVGLGVVGIAPFLYLALLSGKRRIDILAQVPPDLSFKWSRITKNYDEVLFGQGMLDFVVNSIVVVGVTTLLVLVIATPAAYAFSRFRFRGNENLAMTILSMRFMPPIAVRTTSWISLMLSPNRAAALRSISMSTNRPPATRSA